MSLVQQITVREMLHELEIALLGSIPNEEPSSLYEPARYTLKNGGKRFRPLLCMLSCAIESGDFRPSIPAAAGIELLHNFTLLHDDIMDDAPLRRGKQSVYAKWGVNTAILSGDAMFTLAMESILETNVRPETALAIQKLFLKAIRVVCEGQAMDMDFEERSQVRVDEYEDMIYRKTAALVEASMQMGALIGGADFKSVEVYGLIGRNMGIGFQLQDDWLDAGADSERFGKTRGGDVRAGKKTYLWISLRESAVDENEKRLFLDTFAKAANDDSAVEQILTWFDERGIMDKARNKFFSQYEEGRKLLNGLPENEWKKQLIEIYTSLTEREH
jgi:geranylgeranyl diphosphate synthase type II